MKVIVDGKKCQGHGMCQANAPEVYVLDDYGQNNMGEFNVAPGLEDAAELGMHSCPEQAIKIIE